MANSWDGSWQIADTAAGRLDLFWEYGHDQENLLVAALVAEEAGLVVSDASGAEWTATSPSFLAVPKSLHQSIVQILAEV